MKISEWCFVMAFIVGTLLVPGFLIAGILTEEGKWAAVAAPLLIPLGTLCGVGIYTRTRRTDRHYRDSDQIWDEIRARSR